MFHAVDVAQPHIATPCRRIGPFEANHAVDAFVRVEVAEHLHVRTFAHDAVVAGAVVHLQYHVTIGRQLVD